jgi:hypothetical protein
MRIIECEELHVFLGGLGFDPPLSRQCLGRQTIPSFEQRQQQAEAWNRKRNHDGVTIHWQFTRRKARKKFRYNRNKITRSET